VIVTDVVPVAEVTALYGLRAVMCRDSFVDFCAI